MASPINSQGTTFTFNDGTAAQVVGGISGYSGFDGESSEIDVTTLSSSAKEFIVGLEDFGTFTLELSQADVSDVGQAALRLAKTSRDVRECVLTLTDGSVFTFDASVKSFSIAGEVDGADKSTVNLRVTGLPVLT